MKTLRLSLFAAVMWIFSPLVGPVLAADVYYVRAIADLEIVDGKLSDVEIGSSSGYLFWYRGRVMQPYAVIDGPGEAYVTAADEPFGPFARPAVTTPQATAAPSVAIRTAQPRKITGRLFLPGKGYRGMVALKFSIPADQGNAENRKAFLQSKLWHYQFLKGRDIPGTAWFRHQVRVTRRDLGLQVEQDDRQRRFVRSRSGSMEETYALLSGGRAVSENLQLDRILPTAKAEAPTVALDSMQGITIREFDWTAMLEGLEPKQDALATLIPDDQYALLLPSLTALADLADNAGEQGTPVLRAAEPRAEDAQVRRRYERQLGLSLNQLARIIGPVLIDSVAVTGADPYLRTGADVAVLLGAKDAATLRKLVDTQVAISARMHAQAKPVTGEIGGIAFAGFRSPDRSVCSYVATLGDVVVVTNSPAQLKRLVGVFMGGEPSLASLDEYAFFRSRYPLGDKEETGLLILSDKTIRRWCGPRWRIASSRRTRAAALMAEMQAAHFDPLVKGKVTTGPIHMAFALPEAGEFTLTPQGVRSSTYGTLEFLTPIIELDFTHVTKREAEFYNRWRTDYQRNWSNFFDPIAVWFQVSAEKLAIDLTVMPLIAFSEYRELVEASRGAKIAENAGDPHAGTLAHGVFALNTDAPTVKDGANMAMAMIQVNPLDWIGQAIALYVDADPFWVELATSDDPQQMQMFFEDNVHRLPIAANIEVRSGLKLIAFLTALRTFIEQSAPGMTVWEAKQYEEQPYIKVTLSQMAKSGDPWDHVAVYYAASGDALVVTISEDVLKRALDRQTARRQAEQDAKPIPRTALPWLGENLCVTVDENFIQLLQTGFDDEYQQQMQLLAWGNLPVLNEWHRLYREMDPVTLHERFWRRRLVCPGGGAYRWNETWQTMESTIYGHPGEPQRGTSLPVALQSVSGGNFGLTFEDNGLRTRVELQQKTPKE